MALAGDGEDALEAGGERRFLHGDVAEEGVDRREARVAGARRVATFLLEMREEGGDERHRESGAAIRQAE